MRIVVGIHASREVLKTRKTKEIKKVFFKPDWKNSPALRSLALLSEKKGITPSTLSIKKLNTKVENHQGVCIYVEGGPPEWNWNNKKEQATLLLLLHIENPGNLGAIIRTAWLTGCSAVFISRRRSSPLSPSVMKAASGGAEHIPVSFENPKDILKKLKENNFWVYGLTTEAKNSLWEENLQGRVAFILGGEQSGIGLNLKKHCDKLLSIPQVSSNASYNISVAAGITLSECRRQQQTKPLL